MSPQPSQLRSKAPPPMPETREVVTLEEEKEEEDEEEQLRPRQRRRTTPCRLSPILEPSISTSPTLLINMSSSAPSLSSEIRGNKVPVPDVAPIWMMLVLRGYVLEHSVY